MSLVNILDINVLGPNPTQFNQPFLFEIKFECMRDLEEDLEWKIIYVGSAESENFDQVLESILVGPVTAGTNKFLFQADSPDPTKIPAHAILGITVVLLACSYKSREFIRVGYFVYNEYDLPALREQPPTIPDCPRLVRNILLEKPRVTHFAIDWT